MSEPPDPREAHPGAAPAERAPTAAALRDLVGRVASALRSSLPAPLPA